MTGPQTPQKMAEFFALEAGEYLERLDALLAEPQPAADEFVRLARALRGSALMASQPGIGRAALGLEALARAVREGRRAWDDATRQLAVRGVDGLKTFVRRAAQWSDADTAQAEALGRELEQAGGRPSAQLRAAEALGLDAGARAFVAREGAAIASSLDRAAQALRANPLAHDPLQQVVRAGEPLRGLAALADLPPLPDLLEGVERAIGEAPRLAGRSGAAAADLFQAAAAAIAQAAREVADRGRPDPDAPAFREFATLLLRLLDAEPDAVPVESLFYTDAGPHLVKRGTVPVRPGSLGRLELVSHGEHLRQAADSLERAPSATQRELRAHALAATFRSLVGTGGGALAERVSEFAAAARDVVTHGLAVSVPAAVAAELRRAGDILSAAASGDEAELADRLAAVTRALAAVGTAVPPAAPAPAPEPAALRRPAADSAPVPIASLAPAAAPTAPTPAEGPDLFGSWAAYERLAARGLGPASLDQLLAGGTTAAPAIAATAAPGADGGIVEIASLLYRGEGALARIRELREAARDATPAQLAALFEEACDLVALARDGA
jgi:chemotaxis protein histidine kinase CheA